MDAVSQGLNSKTRKVALTEDQKRFLLENSKKYTVDELCEMMNLKPVKIMSECSRIGCGYMTRRK